MFRYSERMAPMKKPLRVIEIATVQNVLGRTSGMAPIVKLPNQFKDEGTRNAKELQN